MLADLPVNPNVIIVFAAVIFAAIKALIEKRQQGREYPEPESREEESPIDLYDQYEAELERQRRAAGLSVPKEESSPPPLPARYETPSPPALAPVRKPKLSSAEKAALENLKRQSPSTKVTRVHSDSTRSRVMKQLASPTAAREALLLGEILGPPKALRPEESR